MNKIFFFVLIFWILIKVFHKVNAQCYLPYIEYNQWGLLNDSLQEILIPKYDYLKNYDANFWIYRKGFKYGILNSNLQEITAPNFSVIYWIDTNKYLVLENNQYVIKYWKDTTFTILNVDTVYQAFSSFIHVGINSKQGVLNYQNVWKIPPIYEEILTNGKDIIVWENGYYYVDTTHQKRFSQKFEEASFFSEHYAAVKQDEVYGFIDEKGNWITQKEFMNAQSFQEGLAPVEKNHRWGFINQSNQLVIPYIYDYAQPFQNGKAIVQFKGKWGVIINSGKILIPFEYDEIQFFEKSLYIVRMKNLWGIINEKREWLNKPEYIDFKKFHCGYWIFFHENKTSTVFNEKGIKIWQNL